MEPQRRCNECNSDQLDRESIGYVCTNCGNFVSEHDPVIGLRHVEYITSRTYVQSGAIGMKHSAIYDRCKTYMTSVRPNRPPGIKFGVELIRSVGLNINLSKPLRELAIKYFENITSNKQFKMASNNTKTCLAISSIYIVCLNDNNPISLSELFKNTDCKLSHMGALLLRVQKQFPEIYPNKTKKIELYVPECLGNMKLKPTERVKMINDTTKLLSILEEISFVQGFNPIYVVYSALFFVWKSANIDRCKIGCNQFCKTVGIEYKKVIVKRVNYYFKALQDLYRKSPFYNNKDLTPHTISLKLPKMLEMKNILIMNYKQSKQSNLEEEEEEEVEIDEDELHEMIEMVKQSRNDLKNMDEESISDCEIDSYIRSNDEIEEVVDLQTKKLIIAE
ncbi:hypothetical protein RDWZM_004834 [Blomia tropicalis]|uniref:BRF2-like C-terminal domain-containing protein n=1 Tax=Blomia tropicalis TaxID=40697 RepID=A0A9Q0M4V1_BLOTA|nr:Transcription factor IIIB 50 kDa subunit [Blomia tropicalis]KAJ6219022.1 hypothetical protein RDWZM_004834 [Blomia tropicalis]